jgi:hypothetical protein
MRQRFVRSGGAGSAVGVADLTEVATRRPMAITPSTVADGVVLVSAASRGRRSGYAGLTAAVDCIRRSAGFEIGHVYVSCTDAGTILPSRIWSVEPPTSRFAHFVRATGSSSLVPGQGLPGRVVCSRAPVVIEPLSDNVHQPRARAAIASGLRAACGYPLEVSSELTVVLEFLTTGSIGPTGEIDALVEQLTAVVMPHLEHVEPADLL